LRYDPIRWRREIFEKKPPNVWIQYDMGDSLLIEERMNVRRVDSHRISWEVSTVILGASIRKQGLRISESSTRALHLEYSEYDPGENTFRIAYLDVRFSYHITR
jgi:hypothetical protein